MTPQQLKQHRQRLGLTQLEMATKIGIGLKTYNTWENSKELGAIQQKRLNWVFKSSSELNRDETIEAILLAAGESGHNINSVDVGFVLDYLIEEGWA